MAKKKRNPSRVPSDVLAINREIRRFLRQRDAQDRPIGKAKGVYAFFDYDHEPIYVGQTLEGLSARIGRHMTNQRTDAVAMNVLDPFEVAYIEIWPLRYEKLPDNEEEKAPIQDLFNAAEYTVFQTVLAASKLGAVLNEKDILETADVSLPPSYKARIVPEDVYEARKHPDIRIARRASTIARLAQVISERDVSVGLRRTLLTQARRLEDLAASRFREIGGEMPTELPGEETGDGKEEA